MEGLVDGRAVRSVGIDDRGLHYGDGVFTTMAIQDGRPLLWPRHRARLDWGCARIGLRPPDWTRLRAEVDALVADDGGASVVKIVLTRPPGRRGYRPTSGRARRIVLRYDRPAWDPGRWARGVRVRLCRWRLGAQPGLAGIKHLNRLEQVMARAEWDDEWDEGLLLDVRGRVVGGTMSNLLLVVDGQLLTPRLEEAGIAGVMRGVVMDLAASWGMPCRPTEVTPAMVEAADELMLSNALIGVWPIAELDGRAWPVGRVTRRILDGLRRQGAMMTSGWDGEGRK